METRWSLETLYPSCDSPEFIADLKALEPLTAALETALSQAEGQSPADGLETVLAAWEQWHITARALQIYLQLSQAADTGDSAVSAAMAQVSRKVSQATRPLVQLRQYIAAIPQLEEVLDSRPLLREYKFFCLELRRQAAHLLSEEAESVASLMDLSGASAWSRMFDYLTSSVQVDYAGKTVSLPEIRGMSADPSPEVRRAAYEAELSAYDKIKTPIAFALNSIKNQVHSLTAQRGYATPLEETLEQSRMRQETLDVMLTAMRESFPRFHSYLRAKGRLFGHENGLPWYDLTAPVGSTDRTFTIEQAGDYLAEVFSAFAPDSAELIKTAFSNRWIDFLPRSGKVGGAFCENIGHGESRILTNFNGTFDAVNTLAHELGHAYHDLQVGDQRPMNQDYPMPIAETASTFNEIHLALYALTRAESRQEKLSMLDLLLSGVTQTICDIYSRFLFESRVFARCKDEFLMPEQLCQIMTQAQEEAYGDGLDSAARHPYMWACKGHYYSGSLSYYNFPYAFGCLLAMGLYRQFQQEGTDFLPKYRALLRATPTATLEDVAKMAGIDLTSREFWQESLNAYGDLIDQFNELTAQELGAHK